MAKKPNEFGSPYDPGNKLPNPKEVKAEQENQDRLGGCGDPRCADCNPETASRFTDAYRGRSLGGNPYEPRIEINRVGNGSFEIMSEEMKEAIRRSINSPSIQISFDELNRMNRGDFSFMPDGRARPEHQQAKPKTPPQSYVEAKEQVKDWIIVAPDQAFDDIIGNAEALGQLRDAIEAPVKHKDLYTEYGMKMPKGALLKGPPGCGKTMFARAAASEMKKLFGTTGEFICISGSEIQEPYVGVTEGHIKNIFLFAREYKAYHGHPLLVFIDEAEVLLPDRTGRIRKVAPWEESQVAVFLAEMDGIQESGAFVLLATNQPEKIDQAVLRDGRCDFKITVKRPDYSAIEAILNKNFAGILVKGETKVSDLVMVALEGLFDPHKILVDAMAIKIDFEKQEVNQGPHKHFLMEHIVSGAMAVSIPGRAKRYAFARDKDTGVITGVTVADVHKAINDLFEENKNLEHGFAMNEFREEFMKELQLKKD